MWHLFPWLLLVLGASHANAVEMQGFGVVREFGRTDNAALFGLISKSGTPQIIEVSGPAFLGGYRVGRLSQAAIDHLFLNSTNPMSQQEKQSLVSNYDGAEVIYFEGYVGSLCKPNESEYEIRVSGTAEGAPFNATIQFIALPNASGDCEFHKFVTILS